jgi:hypothetical protein
MKKAILFCLILSIICPSLSICQEKPKEPEKPAMTLETLQTRMGTLQKGREQAIANVNAYDGAIQECQYWIDYLTPKEVKKDEPERIKDPDKK